MNVDRHDGALSGIASAIAEPARVRMLYCLLDGRARTSTELAAVAGVGPSTASVHLQRLAKRQLVTATSQGKHRYYTIDNPSVAAALEALSVLAGGDRETFVPTTPRALCAARRCYDHIAGTLGVTLHDRLRSLRWLVESGDGYDLTAAGASALEKLGVDLPHARGQRRRFAFPCLDWSERRPHLAGALGSALLQLALKRRWILQELDSRALAVTRAGRRELSVRFGVAVESPDG